MSLPEKNWLILPHEHHRCKIMSQELAIPEAMAALLLARGLENRSQVEKFLSPQLADLPSPFLMKGMREATDLILDALATQKPIIVYGDYDVDGSTGAALLSIFLKRIGFSTVYQCQPDRLSEGYGVHLETVKRMMPEDIFLRAPLLITVDCGISSNQQIKELQGLGCQVIVSDHHRPPPELPEATAILNPWQEDCGFPDKNLAGAGVAFYLTMGVRSRLRDEKGRDDLPNLKDFLDLVSLGSISDLVAITGVNRIMVKAGLEVLRSAARPGLDELCKVSGVFRPATSVHDISFRLAPRLNAAGRLGDAGQTLTLLSTDDRLSAEKLALELDRTNSIRKEILEKICSQAMLQAEKAIKEGALALALAGDGWHPGVLGIAAARLMERFYRPVILFARKDGILKGSGRSLPGLDLHAILKEKNELFSSFGGHPAAVGMSLPAERFEELSSFLQEKMRSHTGCLSGKPDLLINWLDKDGEIINPGFFKYYELMEPFGPGNPEPVFAAKVELIQGREVGAGHLKFSVKINGAILNGIGFAQAGRLSEPDFKSGHQMMMAFRLRRNFFRGKSEWQAEALDFCHAPY